MDKCSRREEYDELMDARLMALFWTCLIGACERRSGTDQEYEYAIKKPAS